MPNRILQYRGTSTIWERFAPNGIASGLSSSVEVGSLNETQFHETAPNDTNEPTHHNPSTDQTMTIWQWLAVYAAAGSFGVAVVQTAVNEPLHQHSGNQPYMQVIR